MDRREFLKSMGMAALSLSVPRVAAYALDAPRQNDNKIVVLFLRAALDGLSAVVPYTDPHYYQVRPKIAISRPGTENGALKLDGNFALHPSLDGDLALPRSA